jgi:hypothetical protein
MELGIGQVIHVGIALFTIIIGLVSVVYPKAAARFTGFGDNVSPRGISEVRSVIGGAFVGLGLAPFLLGNAQIAFQVMGITYLAIGIVRTISILALDKDTSSSSLISVGSEYLFAALLLLIQTPAA